MFTGKTRLPADQTSLTVDGLCRGIHSFALTALDPSSNASALFVIVQKDLSTAEILPGTEKSFYPGISPGTVTGSSPLDSAGGSGCGLLSSKEGHTPYGPEDASVMLSLLFLIFSTLLVKSFKLSVK